MVTSEQAQTYSTARRVCGVVYNIHAHRFYSGDMVIVVGAGGGVVECGGASQSLRQFAK